MSETDPAKVIRESLVCVHPERYAVARIGGTPENQSHFAIFHDGRETTIVTTESRLAECEVLQAESPFALIEFQVSVPFQAPGFLARICAGLAERGINVLVYSTFSSDFLLVRWDELDESVWRLRAMGFTLTDRRPSGPPPT